MSETTDFRPVDPAFCYRCGDRFDRIYHRHAGPGDYCDRDEVDPITVDHWARGIVGHALGTLRAEGQPFPRYLPDDAAAALVRAVLRGRQTEGADALVEKLIDVLVRLP